LQAAPVGRAIGPGVGAAREPGHLPKPALLEPRHGDPPDVVAVELLRGLRAVRRHRAAAGGADAEREDRDPLVPEPGRGFHEVAVLVGLAVAHEQDGAVTALALVLEDLGGGRKRVPDIRGRVPEIVGARRVQEQLQSRLVGRERKLEECAPAEDDQPDPVAALGRHRLPRRSPGHLEPARRHIGDGHGAREVEHHQHVPAGAGELGLSLAQLGARERQKPQRHRGHLQPPAPDGPSLVRERGAMRQHRRLPELAQLGPPPPLRAQQRSADQRDGDEGHQQHHRPGEAHGRLRSRVAPSRSPAVRSTSPGASAQT
jgi:hypothetical protein